MSRQEGLRARALVVILWRAGLRINEVLALAESDLDRVTGAVLVRRGKGGKGREVAWTAVVQPWCELLPRPGGRGKETVVSRGIRDLAWNVST